MADLAFWQTLLSGGAGGGITLAGQWLRGHQEERTQLRVRSHDRSDVRVDRREQFELEVLNNLRTRLTQLIGETYSMREAYEGAEQTVGDGTVAYEGTVGARYQAAWTSVEQEVPVVLDVAVRRRIELFLDDVRAFASATHDWDSFHQNSADVQRSIGERVRAIHEAGERR